MPLIHCPACDRQISVEAEACPQCGHPNRARQTVPSEPRSARSGPSCYRCSAVATTRCHRCGALSCAEHLRNIYVPHGQSGAYELRCDGCYDAAVSWKIFGAIMFFVVLAIMAAIMLGMFR